MIIVWKPKEGFEGFVKVEIPSMRERLIFSKEIAYDTKEDVKPLDNVDRMIKILDICEQKIKEVDLCHIASKVDFESWSEMQKDSLCDKIVEEIASFVVSGGKLGEA